MDDGLAALPPGGSGDDGGHTRPNLTYVGLIREAIVESSEQRLYLREIYEAIANKYPYYRDQTTSTWKNVIRHCLSITPAFKNLPKEVNQPGKGGVWTIDDSIPDAYSRRRIRKSEGSRSSTSASASTSSSSKSNRRRRSSASNGSGSTPAISRSLPSEPSALDPLRATTWSLDPPGTVGSGSSGSAHDPSRSTPAWLSPSSTYSSQAGGGGLFDQSPSDQSDSSALVPSPYSLPHSMPHTSPPNEDAYPPHGGQFGVGGNLGFPHPYTGQGYSTAPPNASLSLSFPAPNHGPHQSFSAPISPSNFSPTLSTSQSAPYGQQPYPLMSQLQIVDGRSAYDPRTFSSGGGGGGSSSSGGGSSRSPMLQMHAGGGPPTSAASGESTSLGLSISQLQWRQLPSVEEQQPTPAYSWPPVPASLHSALQHGAAQQLALGHDPLLAGRVQNDAIAPPPSLQKGTQSSEWDAGLRY